MANARILGDIFRNGRPEVGLEVGTDAGLAANEHVRVPNQMAKEVWVTMADPAPAFVGFGQDNAGWVRADGHVMVLANGEWFTAARLNDDGHATRVAHMNVQPPTEADIRAFVAVNANHIRGDAIPQGHHDWVHAVRFWATVGGFLHSNSSEEFVRVDNPAQEAMAAVPQATVDFIVSFSAEAFTAMAARGASWRKANHATGGEVAQGYPRRWMQKRGYWTTTLPAGQAGGEGALRARQAADTSAFYIATHAAGVHPVLAHMASQDPNHFAHITPTWGLIQHFDVKESTRIRIGEPTQVAGAAMVVDSYVVLEALLQEGTAVLLQNVEQVAALHAARETVAQNGIRVASYSQWFLQGHPLGVEPVPFNQKGLGFAALIGELAVVARQYYRGTTIAASAALQNADSQLCTAGARDRWTEIARNKAQATNEAVIAAWQRIRAGASAEMLRNIASDDANTANAAIDQYNTALRNVAAAMHVTNFPTIQNVTAPGGGDDN